MAVWQAPRDKTPTPPDATSGSLIYGRVAGVQQGSGWEAELVDRDAKNLAIPQTGKAISYAISTLRGWDFREPNKCKPEKCWRAIGTPLTKKLGTKPRPYRTALIDFSFCLSYLVSLIFILNFSAFYLRQDTMILVPQVE